LHDVSCKVAGVRPAAAPAISRVYVASAILRAIAGTATPLAATGERDGHKNVGAAFSSNTSSLG